LLTLRGRQRVSKGAGEKKLAHDLYRKALEVDADYPSAPAVLDALKKLEAEATKVEP
jgi:hypothetical protein